MKITPILHGIVHQGKLCLDESAERMLQRLLRKFDGKEVEMRLTVVRRNRSLNQNAWYWGCIIALLGEHLGYDPEEMHEALKLRFLRTREDSELPSVRSTADLDTQQFSDYCEQCRRLAAELGCVIPDPHQVEVA